MWAPVAWRDGELATVEARGLPPMSFAALYGISLFETLRVYGGAPFALDGHLSRMAAGAEELGLRCRWLAAGAVAEGIVQVLQANGLSDAAVRVTLAAEGYHWEDPRPSLTVAVRGFGGYPDDWYREGIDLVVAPWRRCSEDMTVRLKSANYLTCLRAREFARQAGAEEALLLNCRGQVVEGAVTNIFAVLADGSLVTPPLEDGLLAGVTRGLVMALARECGAPAVERSLSLDDLRGAREVFVTNSLMEAVPVRKVEGRAPAACPGDVTRIIAEAYRREVEKATRM
jgi:branched-subunit amino acid aminotransferase/4-amino-4-deoxychorismate lyase